MSEIEDLVKAYERHVQVRWLDALDGEQRVWFAVYDPAQERRLRPRVEEFATATRKAGHGWLLCDLTPAFAEWMANHDYREAYFETPADMDLELASFGEFAAQRLRETLTRPEADSNCVVAVMGVASLFGLAKASEVLGRIAPTIRGRLLAFFPGDHDGPRWRLLGVGDGWNYSAMPIVGQREVADR